MYRVEVAFTNGDFRGYPDVVEDSLEYDEHQLEFDFGPDGAYSMVINMDNVLAVEYFDEEIARKDEAVKEATEDAIEG
jgi:hypothetical protein